MSDRAIIEAIRKMAGDHKNDVVTYVNAEVVSVDLSSRTCVCSAIDGHTAYDLPNVQLMPIIEDGMLIEPTVGSAVKVIFSQNIEPFICQYSEIENITLTARTKIQLNDGIFGGLIKIDNLIEKMNNLETDLNNLKGTLNIIVASVNALPPSTPVLSTILAGILSGTLSTYSSNLFTPTLKVDLENTRITHGL